MNTHAHSYKRYWEPTYLQTTGLSIVAGAVSSFITYPLEFLKTVIQHQAVGLGFRGRLGTHLFKLSSASRIQSLPYYASNS